MTDLNALAVQGDTIANLNPDVMAARTRYLASVPNVMITNAYGQGINQQGTARKSYDIGTAVSNGHSQEGPTQDAVKAELVQAMGSPLADAAFLQARMFQYELTLRGQVNLVTGTENALSPERAAQIDSLATRGKTMILSIPAVAAASYSDPSEPFQKGFAVATAFCQGNSLPGPTQNQLKLDLQNFYGFSSVAGQQVAKGFDLGQAIQFGLTRSRAKGATLSADPAVAAGQLAITGIANQPGISPDQKAGVATTVSTNPAAKAGAQSQVAAETSLWKKFLGFFGLA